MIRALGAVLFVVLFVYCNEVDDFGRGYVDDETTFAVANYDVTDFTIERVPYDSLIMLDKAISINPPTALLGDLDFGDFGQTKAIINAEFVNARVVDFSDKVLDSIRLTLVYDTAFGVYGEDKSTFNLTVKEIIEEIDSQRYHFEEIAADDRILAEYKDYTFKPKAIYEEIDTTADDTTRLVIPFRIPLDITWAEKFLQVDTVVQNDITQFKDVFKGLQIEATRTDDTGGFVKFNLTHADSRVDLYYHKKDSSTAFRYELIPYTIGTSGTASFAGPPRANFNQIQNTYPTDSIPSSVIGTANLGNAVMKVTIPMTEEIAALNVNDAYLEMTINTEVQDTSDYPFNTSLYCWSRIGQLRTDLLSDYAYQSDLAFSTALGTTPKARKDENDRTQYFYRLKFPAEMRKSIRNNENLTFYIFDTNNRSSPNRTLFYNKEESESYSPKVRILYLDQSATN